MLSLVREPWERSRRRATSDRDSGPYRRISSATAREAPFLGGQGGGVTCTGLGLLVGASSGCHDGYFWVNKQSRPELTIGATIDIELLLQ